MSIESVMPSNHLILCHPILLLPSNFTNIKVFSLASGGEFNPGPETRLDCSELLCNKVLCTRCVLCIRWPKYWSFSFNISPSKEHPGLISFKMDWLDLLAFQGTLKSFLQHHSSKALILQRSAFFVVQLAHPYERLLLNHEKMPGFLASEGEFNPGPETRLDHAELLCNKVLLKYKEIEKASDIGIRRG